MKKLLTGSEIINLVIQSAGAIKTFATTRSLVKMRKTDNPFFDRIEKVSHIEGIMNFDYTHEVDMEGEKFGIPRDFVAQARTWGTRVENSSVIEHKGNHYLEIMVQTPKNKMLRKKPVYLLDGNIEIDKSVFEEFLSKQRPSLSGVCIRTYKLESFETLKLNGKNIQVA